MKTTNTFAVIIDQAGPKSVEEGPDQNAGTEMLDRESAQLVKALSSSEESDGVGKSSAADSATADNKRDMKRRDTQDTDTNDVKIRPYDDSIDEFEPSIALNPNRTPLAAPREGAYFDRA